MRKLSDIRGEEALDVLADLLEPATEIMADTELVALVRSGKKIQAVSHAIRNHKRSIIEILAIMDGESPDTYEPSLTVLPLKIIELLNDPDLIQVFSSQGQMMDGKSFGSATETIKEAEAE